VLEHKKTMRLAWSAVAGLSALTLFLGIVSVVAIRARARAEEQTRIAIEQSNIALSRQLAVQSRTHLDEALDPASLLAVEATDTRDTVEARGALLDAIKSVELLNSEGRFDVAQISISLESIQRRLRGQFLPNYRPIYTRSETTLPNRIVDMKVEIAPNTDSHPGLAPILSQALLRALELGFRLLPMTNWGTVRSPQVTNDMRAHIGGWDDYWAYAGRLSDCSRSIAQMGCGSHNCSLLRVSQDEIPRNQFARAVAEWVDGDVLSAHYAYGCDVFCTNDRVARVRHSLQSFTLVRNAC
jgi:hypothetical protein